MAEVLELTPSCVRVEREVAGATPEQLYAMVADVTRMGEWSPETTSCRWLGDASGPQVGARFVGVNKASWHVWATVCRVTDATPGRRFAFDVALGLPVANWAYRFEPVEGGTRVVQTWTDRRGWLFRNFGWVAHGISDHHEHNAVNMATTLDNLAAAVG